MSTVVVSGTPNRHSSRTTPIKLNYIQLNIRFKRNFHIFGLCEMSTENCARLNLCILYSETDGIQNLMYVIFKSRWARLFDMRG